MITTASDTSEEHTSPHIKICLIIWNRLTKHTQHTHSSMHRAHGKLRETQKQKQQRTATSIGRT